LPKKEQKHKPNDMIFSNAINFLVSTIWSITISYLNLKFYQKSSIFLIRPTLDLYF